MYAILKRPVYAVIAIAATAVLDLLYYFLTLSLISIDLIANMIGIWYLVSSFGFTFIIAALAGINISLLLFRFKGSQLIGIKSSGSASFGTVLTAFTPGCPACTTPLATILSTIGGLALFPLQGLELKLMSMAALLFSFYWLFKSMKLCI